MRLWNSVKSTSPAFWPSTLSTAAATTITTTPPWNCAHTHTHTHTHTHITGGTLNLSSSPSRLLQVLWSAGIRALLLALFSSNTFSHQFSIQRLTSTRFAPYLFNFKGTCSAKSLSSPEWWKMFRLKGKLCCSFTHHNPLLCNGHQNADYVKNNHHFISKHNTDAGKVLEHQCSKHSFANTVSCWLETWLNSDSLKAALITVFTSTKRLTHGDKATEKQRQDSAWTSWVDIKA